jgi:hypothetical protein
MVNTIKEAIGEQGKPSTLEDSSLLNKKKVDDYMDSLITYIIDTNRNGYRDNHDKVSDIQSYIMKLDLSSNAVLLSLIQDNSEANNTIKLICEVFKTNANDVYKLNQINNTILNRMF